MPKVVQKPQKRDDGRARYTCPKCGAVHQWPAKRCFRPGCGFSGDMKKVK